MSEESNQDILPETKIVSLGLGKVVCNWGTHNGIPAVFLEPVLGGPGEVGKLVEDGREPQIVTDKVSAGTVIIEIHSESGLKVLIEDAWKAVHAFTEAHPAKPHCGDCVLIYGKSVCTMNCGPCVPPQARSQQDSQ